jgi:hypothetical protein
VDDADLALARNLLAHEASVGGRDASTAAGRVYDKLFAQLAPLVGASGTELLFMRSAKLLVHEFPSLANVSMLQGSAPLRDALRAPDPVAAESAAALFGTMLTLVKGFIGERLTAQALRRAWPTLEDIVTETKT